MSVRYVDHVAGWEGPTEAMGMGEHLMTERHAKLESYRGEGAEVHRAGAVPGKQVAQVNWTS